MKAAAAKEIVDQCEEVSKLLASLAHPVRLKILCQTMEGEKSVNELVEFCEISQSAVSQFLGRMKADGLLESRREGTRVYYSVRDKKVSLLLHAIKKICT